MRGSILVVFALAGCQLDWDALIGDGGGADAGTTDGAAGDASRDGAGADAGDAGIVGGPITQLSAGGHHTCAIRGGQLLCWGRNDRGQLGAGHRGPVFGAAIVPLTGVRQVSAGALHTCAIDGTDTLYCWGEPSGSRLGTGDLDAHDAPHETAISGGVLQVAAGVEHSCAVTLDGVVYCWGTAQSGEAGSVVGDAVTPTPQPVRIMSGITAQEVAVGDDHSCALMNDRSVWCWGEGALLGIEGGSPTELPKRAAIDDVTALVSGLGHVCALRGDRTVACWGNGFSGEIGNGAMAQQRTPAAVSALAGATDLAAGGHHTCAAVGSELRCWGRGTTGALGVDERAAAAPVTVAGFSVEGPIAAGGTHEDDHTCAVAASGLSCWGHRAWGQLGDEHPLAYATPTEVAGAVEDVSVGGGHLCYRLGGTVHCLGRNGDHQAGDPVRAPVSLPRAIELMEPSSRVAIGGLHSCAIFGGGSSTFCWGDDDYGQLGDGEVSLHEWIPAEVDTPMSTGAWTALAAGARHTCGVRDGAAWCWGDGARGALGYSASGPTPMAGLAIATGVRAIAAGTQLSCALLDAGVVQCWGAGDRGQRGVSGMTDSSTPETVPLTGPAHVLGVGAAHACVTTMAGVECWGDATDGQLGTAPSPVPAPLPMGVPGGIPSMTALALGEGHTCARADDGGVWCWGRNDYGQLGRGHYDSAPAPAAVPDLAGVLDLVAYDHQTCARTESALVCWGMAADGRIVPASGEELFVSRPIEATAAGE